MQVAPMVDSLRFGLPQSVQREGTAADVPSSRVMHIAGTALLPGSSRKACPGLKSTTGEVTFWLRLAALTHHGNVVR